MLLKNIDYVGNASYFIAICASMHQSVLSSTVLVFRGVFGVLRTLVDYCAVFHATNLPWKAQFSPVVAWLHGQPTFAGASFL